MVAEIYTAGFSALPNAENRDGRERTRESELSEGRGIYQHSVRKAERSGNAGAVQGGRNVFRESTYVLPRESRRHTQNL